MGKTGPSTEKGTPYISWVFGKKEEGEITPAKFSSRDIAWNAWMDSFLQELEKHKGQNIIWRCFPEVRFDIEQSEFGNNCWYYIYARFAFEGED
jgi:hypothetical protein